MYVYSKCCMVCTQSMSVYCILTSQWTSITLLRWRWKVIIMHSYCVVLVPLFPKYVLGYTGDLFLHTKPELPSDTHPWSSVRPGSAAPYTAVCTAVLSPQVWVPALCHLCSLDFTSKWSDVAVMQIRWSHIFLGGSALVSLWHALERQALLCWPWGFCDVSLWFQLSDL